MEIWINVVAWLILAAFFIVVEVSTVSLVSIWFGVGSIIASIAAACSANLFLQVLLFSLTSITVVVVIKVFFPNLIEKSKGEPMSNTLIGRELIVDEPADSMFPGKGIVNGVIWTIITPPSEKVERGNVVKVIAVQGNKLLVTLERK